MNNHRTLSDNDSSQHEVLGSVPRGTGYIVSHSKLQMRKCQTKAKKLIILLDLNAIWNTGGKISRKEACMVCMAASQRQGTGSAVSGIWQDLGGQSAQTPSAHGATRVKVPPLILGSLVKADCPPVR